MNIYKEANDESLKSLGNRLGQSYFLLIPKLTKGGANVHGSHAVRSVGAEASPVTWRLPVTHQGHNGISEILRNVTACSG